MEITVNKRLVTDIWRQHNQMFYVDNMNYIYVFDDDEVKFVINLNDRTPTKPHSNK